MKYYSIGYAVNDGLPEVTREDVQKLTHMNLAFGLISENGLLDLHQMTHLDLIPQFRDWNPALRVVLSVGGWGAGGFSSCPVPKKAAAHLRSPAAKPWRSITSMASISTGNTRAATKPRLTVTRAINRTTQSSCKLCATPLA